MNRSFSSPTPTFGPSNAVAGPSRSRYRPASTHLTDSAARTYHSSPTLNPHSRSSTPVLYPNGGRFRSNSVFLPSQRDDEEFSRRRRDSVQKLKSAWEILSDKYGQYSLEDDDEIDLRTGQVVKDRGRLRAVEAREFGQLSEDDEAEDFAGAVFGGGGTDTPDFDSDEDELGVWDERSGLDTQILDLSSLQAQPVVWDTPEDVADLLEFKRMEAERARMAGERLFSEDDRSPSPDLRRHSEQEDGVGSDSNLSPRSRGTRILPARLEDLFLSGGEERESSSEDELGLLGRDEDADEEPLEQTPAPASRTMSPRHSSGSGPLRRRKIPEVVIPVRPRSVSKSALPRPQQANPTTLAQATSFSLNDLFTPPPERVASRPPSRSASVSSVSQRDTAPSKGKERMEGERPHEQAANSTSTPPTESPYYERPWRKSSGQLHQCEACRKAGGRRAERAPWCKGRRGDCMFELNGVVEDEAGHASDEAASDDNDFDDPPHQPISTPSHDLRSSIVDRPASLPLETPPPLSATKRAYKTRQCKSCRQAGGERAKDASRCLGRRSHKACPFERELSASDLDGEVGDRSVLSEDASDIDRSGASRRSVRASSASTSGRRSVAPDTDSDSAPINRPPRRLKSSRTILTSESEDEAPKLASPATTPGRTAFRAMSEHELPSEPADLNPAFYLPGFCYAVNGKPRSCKHCRDALGQRAQKAWWCKGRSWARFCPFLERAETPSPEVSVSRRTPLTPSRSGLVAGPRRNGTPSTTTALAPPRHQCQVRTNRKSLSIATYIPSPPHTSSIEPASPVVSYSPSFSGSRSPMGARSSSTMSSMPPSSPPIRASQSSRPPHPTPSPSVSIVPEHSKYSVSPSRPIAPLPKRGATVAYQPTPSPSISGMRSSSILSDTVHFKSALRRPSESCGPSSSSSVKRARFSLVYRSPPPEFSSDPVRTGGSDQDGESGDELALGNDQYDSSSYPSTSPAFALPRYASSSSPLRTEWSVRAADVGMKLGPEHTGRVPSNMVRALAPSLSVARPTLGSSLGSGTRDMGTDGTKGRNFTLPTPPLSSGSTSSHNSAIVSSTSPRSPAPPAARKNTTPSGSGLMLPPPVPAKRLATPGRPNVAGSPSLSTLGSSDVPAMAVAPEAVQIKFTCRPAASLKDRAKSESRARSRSMSVAPVTTPSLSQSRKTMSASAERYTTPVPSAISRLTGMGAQSTPTRKKNRVERELERVAREMGDDAGLEWGLDEDTEDGGRGWREGSVVSRI